jgi:hypothetical protein
MIMPVSCHNVSRWPSAAQPTAAATTGDSSPSSETRAAGILSRPRNHSEYARAVPMSER